MPNPAVIQDKRSVITGRFSDNLDSIAVDLLQDFVKVENYGDFEIVETTIQQGQKTAQRRINLMSDSLAWQGFQIGKIETLDAAGALFKWELDPGADHCMTCLIYAAAGPYTIDSLPGVPGEAPTLCNGSCRCNIVPH